MALAAGFRESQGWGSEQDQAGESGGGFLDHSCSTVKLTELWIPWDLASSLALPITAWKTLDTVPFKSQFPCGNGHSQLPLTGKP